VSVGRACRVFSFIKFPVALLFLFGKKKEEALPYSAVFAWRDIAMCRKCQPRGALTRVLAHLVLHIDCLLLSSLAPPYPFFSTVCSYTVIHLQSSKLSSTKQREEYYSSFAQSHTQYRCRFVPFFFAKFLF
jgi:hypothetical protein